MFDFIYLKLYLFQFILKRTESTFTQRRFTDLFLIPFVASATVCVLFHFICNCNAR